MDFMKPSSERIGNIPLQGKQGGSRRAVPGKARTRKGKSGQFGKNVFCQDINGDEWTAKGT